MAKATKSSNASSSLRKVTKKRPGIHSTSKYSKLKSSNTKARASSITATKSLLLCDISNKDKSELLKFKMA